jgi:hypothetical protein
MYDVYDLCSHGHRSEIGLRYESLCAIFKLLSGTTPAIGISEIWRNAAWNKSYNLISKGEHMNSHPPTFVQTTLYAFDISDVSETNGIGK